MSKYIDITTNHIDRVTARLASEKTIVLQRKALISRPEDRMWFQFVAGENLSVRVRSAEVGGAYSILEGILAPQSGPPLHIHLCQDEVLEVLEGSLRFICEGEIFDAPTGTIVVIPKGARHTWRNVTDQPVRALATLFPGGIESMFEEFVGKEPAEMDEIARRYGTLFVGPPLEGDETSLSPVTNNKQFK